MCSKKVYTLVLVKKDNNTLLGMKKRGFGEGKWNGFGGKVETGETNAEGAAREVKEECGLDVDAEELEYTAMIAFEFKGDTAKLEMHVFQTKSFSSEIIETDEMRPQWFDEETVPFDEMWVDASRWYQLMFRNKKFNAYFLLDCF